MSHIPTEITEVNRSTPTILDMLVSLRHDALNNTLIAASQIKRWRDDEIRLCNSPVISGLFNEMLMIGRNTTTRTAKLMALGRLICMITDAISLRMWT
ncbi:hypothetical protein PSE_1157 [Pseudovibrio sp. FO-BEG1]|nr:hypothetical protein PSE_1157 [Pseudovibrio sp. FO-BEG1]